jgi:hypothetical protein
LAFLIAYLYPYNAISFKQILSNIILRVLNIYVLHLIIVYICRKCKIRGPRQIAKNIDLKIVFFIQRNS